MPLEYGSDRTTKFFQPDQNGSLQQTSKVTVENDNVVAKNLRMLLIASPAAVSQPRVPTFSNVS